MYALQCTQCDSRNQLPQMRLPEPAAQEQRAKSVIEYFNIFFSLFRFSYENRMLKKARIKVTLTFMHV